MKTFWLAAAAAAALSAAAPAFAEAGAALPAQTAGAASSLTETPRMGPWGFDMAGRDTSTPPGQDFFKYANGRYVQQLEIPPDRSRYGAFDRLQELSQNRMRAVLEAAANDASASGGRAKVGAFYRSFMDEPRLEAIGVGRLARDLDKVREIETKNDLARLMGRSQLGFGGSFFGPGISDDAKAPMRYAVYLGQAGLGLPNRDYYLKPEFAPKLAAYQAYVAQILALAGWNDPQGAAKAIVAMETEIAQVSWTLEERRDDSKTYNPIAVSELAAFAPGFDWKAFLDGAELGQVQRVVLQENTAIPKIAAIYARTPLETLKAWQAFSVADQAAPYLSQAFDQAHYQFREKTLQGQPQQRARWKRGVSLVDAQMGEALGKLYVAQYFPPQSKEKMLELVSGIREAMKGRIERLDWMSPDTKAKALEKLSKFSVKIGYPDKWRDYSALTIKDDDLYGNVERASAFEWNRQVARLDKPVDRTEWGMTPPTVNAYYQPTRNEIVFPAAILQPPFFDPKGDPAVNYGGIGGVIGHELTHGFDDQGRKSDGDGMLTDWWTPQDAAKFDARAAVLGKQYSAFEVLPGAHVNGGQTMGENIADLGGLLLALDAYHASLKGQPAPVIDGMTGEQRVFLGWAQVWRGKLREDRLRQLLVVDVHSPNEARVDVPVRNIDAFYQAFGVKPGDAMYVAPTDRARIW
ncbi:MAG TPA: M13-type metalloendopeptidase [Phenylobacterium sp.]|uniref:M13 family metallopeptidase n=1 Tax=Phenylobacterium sp. TaxID=1871053 RepID=UPI002B497E4B|nr:M13-type metalloendopeptidase [Phenylobacterium sp.]HKR86786.1 M13-type metalloendopeptidase [Phenylobacterium sp.]